MTTTRPRGRHAARDDDDDEVDEAAIAAAQLAYERERLLTETGRHYLIGIAELDLADDAVPEPVEQTVVEDTVVEGTAVEDPAPERAVPEQTAVERIAVEPVAPVPASRAGRNLPAAIAVGLGLAAAVIVSLFTYRPSFLVIICVAMVYGVYEMTRAIGSVEARPPLVPLVVGGLAMDIAAWYQGANGLVIGLLLTTVGLTVWRLADGAVGYLRDVAAALLILLYVPLLGGFAVLLVHPHDGAGRVMAFIGTVVCSDVGGYIAGVLFGKHPMAPTVSPKKSWEGFAGSVIACCVCGVLILTLTFHQAWWFGALYGLAIAVTATVGDLGESMIKRDLGRKDMGRLLPGHGGLMDRLDSLLPCAAVAFLILSSIS